MTIPGTLSATSFSRAIDIEEDLGATPITTNTTPFAISYGYWSPMEKPKLYQCLLTTLGEAIAKKFAHDAQGTMILPHAS